MASRRTGVRALTLLAAAFALPVMTFVARADDQAPDTGGRKPFSGARSPEERHPLLDAWRARHDQTHQSSGSALGRSALVVGGTPIVGRASMVINAANSVVYTKNFIGTAVGSTCDADMGAPNIWQPSSAYAAGDHVARTGGGNFMATNAGTTGTVQPAWNIAFGATTVDGTITWVSVGTGWATGRAYTAGMVVRTTAGFIGFNFKCVTAGTSGATEPKWPTTPGATVADNGAVWQAIGFYPGSFTACNPMQLVLRASGGGETVIAKEGDAVGPSQLSGWGEFIAMNSAGTVAFRAAVAGLLTDNDETGSGIFLAGPGAGALTKIATSYDVIGGRINCGFSSMVGINDAGQVIFEGYATRPSSFWLPAHAYILGITVVPTTPNGLSFRSLNAGTSGAIEPVWPTTIGSTVVDGTITWLLQNRPLSCDEKNHALIRRTAGPGNELLVAQGSSVGGSTVVGFGNDDNSGASCVGCTYNDIDGLINSAGHVPVVLRLADGTQGVYNFSAPGVSTQVARTGGANPYTALSPRVSINNADQVAFKGVSGGLSRIFRFTPPATTATVVSAGDDLGVRGGGPASGVTFASFGNFVDLNNSGNLVFQAKLSGAQEGFYYWDGSTGLIKEVFRKADTSSLASEMITLNDLNQVAYVTGSTVEGGDDHSEGHETGGVFFWKAGATQTAIKVGDVVGGNAVTAVYAQHLSFMRRQQNSVSCLATAYTVAGDDAEMDCNEGATNAGCYTKSPLLFISCASSCPAILLSPPTLPGGAMGVAYNQTITATGGASPYTFAVTSGALPTGMNPLSAGGVLSGTPTAAGTFNFTVTATDANLCTSSQAYSIVVGAAAQVNLTISPNALTTTSPGGTISYTVTISVAQGSNTIVTLTSGNPAVVTVPATVTILAGQTTATFSATGVSVGGPVVITAALPASFNAPPATAYASVGGAAAAAPVPTLGAMALMLLAAALAIGGALLLRK